MRTKNSKLKKVAIIGISCRFPGGIETPENFWDLLISQKDTIHTLPPQRWRWPENIDVTCQHRGIDRGGFFESVDQFDATYFKISPREAKLMDPQQRMLLEMSRHCFDDAGYEHAAIYGSDTAVFIGISNTDYHELLMKSLEQTGGYLSTGSGLFAAANRLSYFYNFTGPSLSIDTASSSSLVALCQAVDAIQSGTCSQALAGGINLICTSTNSISYYKAGMLSPDGQCKSFDASANGYVRGEGGGLLLLKALDAAERDGDQIYSVIRASDYRHGGHTSSITVPSAEAQASLLNDVYHQQNLELNSISYIETHGSGTAVGDPIEIEGLKKAFATLNKPTQTNKVTERCGLGSVKSNIGHLEAASGIAGVIKVLMSMKHKRLPGTLHHNKLNPDISFDGTPFYIVEKTEPWFHQYNNAGELQPLRAGVSSFGLGGVNAHVLLEEYNLQTNARVPLPAYPFNRECYWVTSTYSHNEQIGDIKKSATSNSLMSRLQNEICLIMSDILQVSTGNIELNDEMSDLGFDSLSFRELSSRLNEKFGFDLTPIVFFETHTLEGLSRYLVNEYADLCQRFGNNDVVINLKQNEYVPKKMIETNSEEINKNDIAIIGMAGEFPQSEDLSIFWNNLILGNNLVTEIPAERKGRERFFADIENSRSHIKYGGFIRNASKFDADFFNISPLEAELMDPQQRRFIQVAWHTMEDAGLTPQSLSGSNTGVFVGVMTSDYNDLLTSEKIEIEAYTPIGLAHSMLANRISFLLNLHGPSEAIDTACSSSLVALHRAVESIQRNECDAAFVGGVNLILSPTLSIAFDKAGMLSHDGLCKTGDKNANGYVRAEAVVAVLLKPLSKAITDGNVIHAVIKGSAVNHGGRATSLTAPNTNSQAELLISAYQNAKIDPASVSYIELHGTGTSLGDPIEFRALKKAFSKLYQEYHDESFKYAKCGIGSVKTNMGHAEAAAGMAGLIKVVLAMKHQCLPGNLHFTEKNPLIDFNNSPFYMVDKTQPWLTACDAKEQLTSRRAGVSSFGFGGVNAHIIIEEYTPLTNTVNRESSSEIIVLSAKNKTALMQQIINLQKYICDIHGKELRVEKLH